MASVPMYREMLREFLRIKYDDDNDFFGGRYVLSFDEVIQILRARTGAQSHPL